MARTLINQFNFFAPYDNDDVVDDGNGNTDDNGSLEGGFRFLACADTGAWTPLGV